MKVLLINPSPEVFVQDQYYNIPPLGLGYIAAYLESKSIECSVIDAKMEKLNRSQIVERVCEESPDIVGITAMTHEIVRANQIAADIRKKISPKAIIIGGAHATALPEETLEQFDSFDISVFGEGEYTLYEIAERIKRMGNSKQLDDIKGCAFRRDGKIHVNDRREWIVNLDELPFPAWHLFPQTTEYPIYTERGCPYRCIFCMRVLGNRLRKRSPENVIQEIEMLVHEFHAERIIFRDETFGVDKNRDRQLLKYIIERGINKKIRWSVNSRVNIAEKEFYLMMKEAGCTRVEFGIESGNQEILDTIKKGITLQQAEEAVKMAKEVGLKTACFFILGHPGETIDTINDTINFASKLNPDDFAFGIMVPYPKTEIAEMAAKGEGGYRLLSTDWASYDKYLGNALELKNITRDQLEKLQSKAYLYMYLKNLRFRELFGILLKYRKAVVQQAKKMFISRFRNWGS